MSPRFSEQRSFTTIESERLPTVGEPERYRLRAALWRRIFCGLVLFWAGVIATIAFAHGTVYAVGKGDVVSLIEESAGGRVCAQFRWEAD